MRLIETIELHTLHAQENQFLVFEIPRFIHECILGFVGDVIGPKVAYILINLPYSFHLVFVDVGHLMFLIILKQSLEIFEGVCINGWAGIFAGSRQSGFYLILSSGLIILVVGTVTDPNQDLLSQLFFENKLVNFIVPAKLGLKSFTSYALFDASEAAGFIRLLLILDFNVHLIILPLYLLLFNLNFHVLLFIVFAL